MCCFICWFKKENKILITSIQPKLTPSLRIPVCIFFFTYLLINQLLYLFIYPFIYSFEYSFFLKAVLDILIGKLEHTLKEFKERVYVPIITDRHHHWKVVEYGEKFKTINQSILHFKKIHLKKKTCYFLCTWSIRFSAEAISCWYKILCHYLGLSLFNDMINIHLKMLYALLKQHMISNQNI
jgi:hypothetical protein